MISADQQHLLVLYKRQFCHYDAMQRTKRLRMHPNLPNVKEDTLISRLKVLHNLHGNPIHKAGRGSLLSACCSQLYCSETPRPRAYEFPVSYLSGRYNKLSQCKQSKVYVDPGHITGLNERNFLVAFNDTTKHTHHFQR